MKNNDHLVHYSTGVIILLYTGNETVFGSKHKSSPLSRLSTWKLLDKFNVIYLGALFFKKTYYKYLENNQILNSKNNLDIFVVVCIPTPEFNIALIQFSRNISIIDT